MLSLGRRSTSLLSVGRETEASSAVRLNVAVEGPDYRIILLAVKRGGGTRGPYSYHLPWQTVNSLSMDLQVSGVGLQLYRVIVRSEGNCQTTVRVEIACPGISLGPLFEPRP